jgi:hypothetical protein
MMTLRAFQHNPTDGPMAPILGIWAIDSSLLRDPSRDFIDPVHAESFYL